VKITEHAYRDFGPQRSKLIPPFNVAEIERIIPENYVT
jgi:hypothetical protein